MFKELQETRKKFKQQGLTTDNDKKQFDILWNDYQALEQKQAHVAGELEAKTRAIEEVEEQKKTVEYRLEKLTELAHQLNEKIIAKNQRLK